jgi:sarcosine oxidase subunit gamma
MAEQMKRRSALEAVYTVKTTGEKPGISITERHPLTIYDIGGTPSGPIAGCPIPNEPNTVSINNGNQLLWLSPSRWLLVSTDQSTVVVADIKRDVSSGRTVLRLSGPNVRDVLAKGCPLDLHHRTFKLGTCAQSRIGSLNVLIVHVEDGTFDVYVARGFALTFWEWLIEASAEYGYDVLNTVS